MRKLSDEELSAIEARANEVVQAGAHLFDTEEIIKIIPALVAEVRILQKALDVKTEVAAGYKRALEYMDMGGQADE